MLKIAAAASVVISEATQAVYLEELIRLHPDALAAGAQRTIREWDKPNMMPPLAFILARCELPQREDQSFLKLGAKPPDWEPLKPGELEQMLKDAAEKLRMDRPKSDER